MNTVLLVEYDGNKGALGVGHGKRLSGARNQLGWGSRVARKVSTPHHPSQDQTTWLGSGSET